MVEQKRRSKSLSSATKADWTELTDPAEFLCGRHLQKNQWATKRAAASEAATCGIILSFKHNSGVGGMGSNERSSNGASSNRLSKQSKHHFQNAPA